MPKEEIMQHKINRYISSLLLEQFGEKPAKINISINQPFVIIHLLGFLMPSEKVLLKRNQQERIWQTRDVIIQGLKQELLTEFQTITGMKVTELYADWNLDNETGLLIAVTEEKMVSGEIRWPESIDKKALQEKVISFSEESQKAPDKIETYWLNEQTILIERTGIMVNIEKQLIRNGVIEELRLAKRPLEHQFLDMVNSKPILKKKVKELFTDWNFEEDKAYLVLILEV